MKKNILSVILVILLIFNGLSLNFRVFAQEILEQTPSPDPVLEEPTAIPEVVESSLPSTEPYPTEIALTNGTEVVDEITSEVNTGNNDVLVFTPSPTPLPSPSDIPINTEEPMSNVENVLDEEVQTSAVSPTATPLPTALPTFIPSPTPNVDSLIITGDSVSVANVENNVNNNLVNSTFIHQTLNIFVADNSGDIDLSKLAENAVNKVFTEDANKDGVVNLSAVSVDNFAYVENNIEQSSNTGYNQVLNGAGSGVIETGDAYSIVTVLNNVNTNILNSKFYLITINIFTDYKGNIILPEIATDDNVNDCCIDDVAVNNSAAVENKVTSVANTGINKIEAIDSGEIQTGEAESVVNIFNLVNTNYIGVVFKNFTIKNFGTWLGDFLGWGDMPKDIEDNISLNYVADQNNAIVHDGCTNCSNSLDINNSAVVKNNIISSANTGNNEVNAKNGLIKTGKSYFSVSIFNLVNSNIYNSTGFVGFINIFGSLVGDIGGEESFVKDEDNGSNESEDNKVDENQQDIQQLESGGEIELTGGHNVNEYVFAGDTVTFNAKVKNVGTGKLYNTTLSIELLKGDDIYGGAQFALGDIGANKSKTLTTGLTLSKLAQPGIYIAKIIAIANVGPNSDLIKKEIYTEFRISGFNTTIATISDSDLNVEAGNLNQTPEVLGISDNGLSLVDKLKYLFVVSLVILIIGRLIQSKNKFIPIYKIALNYARRIGSLLSSLFA